MKGHLIINFTDGSHKRIGLEKAIELDLTGDRLRSLELRETRAGHWIMAYDKRLMQGKRGLETIVIANDDNSRWYGDARFYAVERMMRSLTSEQRHKIMSRLCPGCGSLDPSCHCQNDE